MAELLKYPAEHWIRDPSPSRSLDRYLEQQNLVYSRIKNGFIKELLGNLSEKKFLDYGCGAGFFLVYATRKRAKLVIGVDAEKNVLSTARYFAAQQGAASVVHLIQSHEFPVFNPKIKFDVFLIKDVIEHVPNDLRLLQAAAQVITPGGKIIISTQNSLSLNYLIQGTWNRLILGDKQWYGWDPTHVRFYTPKSLKKLLSHAGFTCRKWRSLYLVPYKWPAPRFFKRKYIRLDALSGLDRALGDRFPFNRFGWNLVVEAIKR